MWDTVTGWVGDLEQIHDKVQPAEQRRNNAVMDSFEHRNQVMEDSIMDADHQYHESNEEFWQDIMDAQHDFEVRMENEGIAQRDRELGQDIEAQFERWGNMRRVGRSTTSLAKTSANKALKKLEREIDAVLATLWKEYSLSYFKIHSLNIYIWNWF